MKNLSENAQLAIDYWENQKSDYPIPDWVWFKLIQNEKEEE